MTAAAQTLAAPATGAAAAPLLSVRELTVSVRDRGVTRPLVEGLSFDLRAGETLAIAGESGSGKSITSLALMGLLPNNVTVTSGQALLDGTDLPSLPEASMRDYRGAKVAMIFQEPMTSLNPVHSVGSQLVEAIRAHEPVSRREAHAAAVEALRRVRISEPERRMGQYPHELSGGMRQRVMIAQAMLCDPKLLIADEPTTALDVTVQAEVLDLMATLQKEMGTAIALITHDMGVVARMCDHVKVMRLGEFVEDGPVEHIFARPEHAYTRKLLEAMPRIDKGDAPGDVTGRTILDVDDLKVHFPITVKGGLFGRTVPLKAVNGVSFDLKEGETLGIVGESGCGKSTLARAVLQLIASQSGTVSWLGKPLTELDRKALKRERRDLQIVFQDPLAS
uniref:ATP-binding cassette domain-containing protein n=1 Tax=Salipiger bermudensis TaxID=344736 RepID=UPI00351459B0